MGRVTRRAALGAGVAMAFASSDVMAAEGGDRALVRRLRERCEHMARVDGLSGAVLLARHGAPIFRAAYGQRNRAERLPNRPDTKFNLASIGKMFTSLAVLRLVENGRMRLTDRLIDLWPDYPNRDVAAQVTVEQLLTHTAGIGNFWSALGQTPPQSVVTLADVLALFVNDPLEQAPGASFSYSNGGYIILGMLVERITGEDYFTHCRRTIFEPLGMHNTDFYRMDDSVSNLAIGYLRDLERQGVWRNNIFDVFRGSSAGGVYASIDDMLRFANALSRNQLVGAAMTEEWTRGRYDYHRGRYGLGVSEMIINGHRILGHSGGHFGVASEIMIFEDIGYTFIILTNGEVETFWDLERFIKRELVGEDESARNYWFTRDLIDAFANRGPAGGEAFYTRRPVERIARESLIDHYGHANIHAGRIDTGLALLEFNLRIFPDSIATLWGMAEGYRHLGRRGDAVTAYRAYLTRAPDDADALRYIAQLDG